jgi:predicted DNA-binding transcriptional regulator YafY
VDDDRGVTRAIRLTRIQHLLHSHPKGLTSRELARLCGVCMRTIQRDLLALQNELGIPLAQEGDYYSILEGYVLPPVSLSLFEALAAFLALRLSLRQNDKDNPHIEQALTKIARILPSPLATHIEQSIRSISREPATPEVTHVFEQVALAWTTRRQMRIMYHSLQSDDVKEWLLEPYFVDMTGVGYSTYVIGHAVREGKEGLITFKLDRIRTAEVLDANFEIPSSFDMHRLLSHSWGIIWGEDAEIKLKFSARVSRRVKESVWHPSQRIEDLKDGGCSMTMKVGSVLEATPWIRGWGPDVEVIQPESLRNDFKKWSQELNVIYRR